MGVTGAASLAIIAGFSEAAPMAFVTIKHNCESNRETKRVRKKKTKSRLTFNTSLHNRLLRLPRPDSPHLPRRMAHVSRDKTENIRRNPLDFWR